jgi:hypothetical protein
VLQNHAETENNRTKLNLKNWNKQKNRPKNSQYNSRIRFNGKLFAFEIKTNPIISQPIHRPYQVGRCNQFYEKPKINIYLFTLNTFLVLFKLSIPFRKHEQNQELKNYTELTTVIC